MRTRRTIPGTDPGSSNAKHTGQLCGPGPDDFDRWFAHLPEGPARATQRIRLSTTQIFIRSTAAGVARLGIGADFKSIVQRNVAGTHGRADATKLTANCWIVLKYQCFSYICRYESTQGCCDAIWLCRQVVRCTRTNRSDHSCRGIRACINTQELII